MLIIDQPFIASSLGPLFDGVGILPVDPALPVEIMGVEAASTQSQNGRLKITLHVFEGPHLGRTGAYNLNLWHSSEQVVRIATEQLAKLCHCVGLASTPITQQNLSVFNGRRFLATVVAQKGLEAEAKGYTEVTGVSALDGSKPYLAGAAAAPAAPAPAASPWAAAVPAAAPAAAPANPWAAAAPAAAPAASPWGKPA